MHQEIWLLRHGYYSSNGSLTHQGAEQIKQAATLFNGKAITIYYSPVTRCVETAMILKNAVTQSEWHQLPWLGESGKPPENCLAHLKGDTVVIVSHQPTLCRIVAQIGNHANGFSFSCGSPVKLITHEAS